MGTVLATPLDLEVGTGRYSTGYSSRSGYSFRSGSGYSTGYSFRSGSGYSTGYSSISGSAWYYPGSMYQHDELLLYRELHPDPRRETTDKISKLIESTPECCGLAIMIPGYTELNDISEFLTNTCRFAVFNPPAQSPPGYTASSFLRSQMESLHLVELNHRPIVVVVSGIGVGYHRMYTSYGWINIEDDVLKPLFSAATSHFADNSKIFLFISSCSYPRRHRLLQSMFPASGGNYIVGYVRCHDVDIKSTILGALESPQQSVQDIFKSLHHKITPHYGHMKVIDNLNEPVYLHPDAPQGTHSGPGKPHPPHNTSHTLPPYRTHQEAAR